MTLFSMTICHLLKNNTLKRVCEREREKEKHKYVM